jgi:2-methylcitrate dehydratase
VDRQVTPLQFTPEKIMDSAIRAQLRKVEVVADPEIEKVFPALQRVMVTIRTTGCNEFSKQLDFPKGDPRNPLSDREIEEKFAALAGAVLSKAAQQKVKDAIWRLEKLRSVSELMRLLKADVRPAAKRRAGGRAQPRRT